MKISDIFESENDGYVFSGLYHSSEVDHGDITYVPSSTQNREPKDILKTVHNYVNNLTMKKFGVPVRNGLFTTRFPMDNYGPNIFKVYVQQEDTRIFLNNDVTDLLKYIIGVDEYNFFASLSDIIKPILGDEYPSYGLWEKTKKLVRVDMDHIHDMAKKLFGDNAEILKIVDDYIDNILGKLKQYVNGLEEAKIDDLEPYDNVEFMVYSTKRIKLVAYVE